MVAGTNEDPLGASVVDRLPGELHDMLTAALSNSAYRLYKEKSLSLFGIDSFMDTEDEFDIIGDGIWNDLAEPSPQMKRFIRRNRLRQDIYECHTDPLCRDYGRWTSVAHRIFEQQVYDFGRSLGLSKNQAKGHVIKARGDSSRCNVDLMDLDDYESSECEDILNYIYTLPEPDVLPSAGNPKGFMFVSEDDIKKFEDLLEFNVSKVAKQVERYVETLKANNLRAEYEMIILRLRFHEREPLIDIINGLREKVENLEAAGKMGEERLASKNAKKARKAELRAQKKALRRAEKRKSQTSDDHHAERPKKQKLIKTDSEHLPEIQPIEGQDKPLKQKKKGRKRKSELQLQVQSEAHSAEPDKHKNGRVGGDAQDTTSQKAKRKRRTGPQHSPFFQWSSDPKSKRHAVKKAEQLPGFQSPMIQ